jgi:hypothetical protein
VSGTAIVVRANFDRKPAGRGEAKKDSNTGRRSPGVVHLLALAHQIERKIRDGELRDYAHAARVLGVTRARVSQISGLTLLAPAIQEEILSLPDGRRDPITERQLREIVAEPLWEKQMRLWRLVRRHR